MTASDPAPVLYVTVRIPRASLSRPAGTTRGVGAGAVPGAGSGYAVVVRCRLDLDGTRRQLACPCHGATFTLAGAPLTHPHNSHPLPALPRLPVRVDQGRVQVYAPASEASDAGGGPGDQDPA